MKRDERKEKRRETRGHWFSHEGGTQNGKRTQIIDVVGVIGVARIRQSREPIPEQPHDL